MASARHASAPRGDDGTWSRLRWAGFFGNGGGSDELPGGGAWISGSDMSAR